MRPLILTTIIKPVRSSEIDEFSISAASSTFPFRIKKNNNKTLVSIARMSTYDWHNLMANIWL